VSIIEGPGNSASILSQCITSRCAHPKAGQDLQDVQQHAEKKLKGMLIQQQVWALRVLRDFMTYIELYKYFTTKWWYGGHNLKWGLGDTVGRINIRLGVRLGPRRGLGACLPSYPNKFSDMTEMEIVTRGAFQVCL
jgi:hypothetical protein